MGTTKPASLRDALRRSGPPDDAALLGADARVPLTAIATGTCLDRDPALLAGRSIMLITRTQSTAALGMLDCDGLVRRMVLCPPDLDPAHMRSVMADAEVDTIVTDREVATFDGLEVDAIVRCSTTLHPADWDRITATAPHVATEWVMATSGTSGLPKLVVHDLAALTGAIASSAGQTQRVVWGTFYDIRRYGGLQIFLRAILGGRSLVLSQAGEPLIDHLTRLNAAGITHLSGTPSHWRKVLMSAEAAIIAPTYVRLSGEIADQAVLDSLGETFPGAKVGHAYASTEAGVGFEVNDGLEGFPAALLDATGGALAMRIEDGSLRMKSNRMASRYLGADPPTLIDPDGFVDTGDMIERRGDRCYFVGRRGGIINVGGLKVHPEEIEAVINRHDQVRMSLVKSRRSPITGGIVVAEVVLIDAALDEGTVRDAIIATCRASLPPHKVPAMVRFVTALEVTPGGKLARPGTGADPAGNAAKDRA
ncbi:AMP-binding protein [Lichenihabitans psoromatis]|uniref:AMP-binding protein n=1 Tax=Lichenihabitans psoromatis TaxID=2528642 RepID=UPI0010385283|nr:AMP-binding protein [Lichenihabitans psoromatis]